MRVAVTAAEKPVGTFGSSADGRALAMQRLSARSVTVRPKGP
jgi:hypothetical protein